MLADGGIGESARALDGFGGHGEEASVSPKVLSGFADMNVFVAPSLMAATPRVLQFTTKEAYGKQWHKGGRKGPGEKEKKRKSEARRDSR